MRFKYSALIATAIAAAALAGDPPDEPRALPPEWSAADEAVFFDDARELLQGERPDFAAGGATPAVGPVATTDDADANANGYKWSALISAEVIEGEIKRTAQKVTPLVQSASGFKGGDYREARDHFSMIAVLFGTAAEFDQDVRWRDDAAALAQLFARAGFNCKVGTDQSFREAQLREQDLAELIRGGRPDAPNPDPDAGWDKLSDRSPLMKRMETVLDVVRPNLSDGRTFERNAEDIAHEAQLMALLGELIAQDGMDDAGDETYDGYAHQLRDASVELNKSVELESYDAARTALGNMLKACSDCHGDYRG